MGNRIPDWQYKPQEKVSVLGSRPEPKLKMATPGRKLLIKCSQCRELFEHIEGLQGHFRDKHLEREK